MRKAFFNSLPKSGTNLVAKCLELFGYTQAGGLASSIVLSNHFRSKVRRMLWRSVEQGYLIGIDTPVEIARRPIDRNLSKVSDNMFIFGHLGYTADILVKVRDMGFALILIIRDPRAVLNSFVYYVVKNKSHVLHKAFCEMSVEERYLAALQGHFSGTATLQSMRVRCKALDPWLESDDVLKLQFEGLVGAKGGSSDELQRQTLAKICEHLAISKTKIDEVAQNLHGPGRVTFRKGQIDSWKEEIPASVASLVNEQLADILGVWVYPVDTRFNHL